MRSYNLTIMIAVQNSSYCCNLHDYLFFINSYFDWVSLFKSYVYLSIYPIPPIFLNVSFITPSSLKPWFTFHTEQPSHNHCRVNYQYSLWYSKQVHRPQTSHTYQKVYIHNNHHSRTRHYAMCMNPLNSGFYPCIRPNMDRHVFRS